MQNQTNNMMKKLRIIAAVAAFVVTGSVAEAQIAAPEHLNDTHTMLRVTPTARYLLLPVEEKEENAHVDVLVNNHVERGLNLRLAVDKVDYFVPVELEVGSSPVLFDITFPSDRHKTGSVKNFVCWKEMSLLTDRSGRI